LRKHCFIENTSCPLTSQRPLFNTKDVRDLEIAALPSRREGTAMRTIVILAVAILPGLFVKVSTLISLSSFPFGDFLVDPKCFWHRYDIMLQDLLTPLAG
jgi:hypothetical protein